MTRSTKQVRAGTGPLTELEEGVLVLDGLHFRQVIDIVRAPVRVAQLVLERVGHLLQEHEHQLLVVLSLRNCQVNNSFPRDEAAHSQTC